ncbi:hypothetical protein BC834DRAFT_858399 [Gloeopeniophorella convolvens]|nr:hypothetical protein BC834DRAFT_858399 [Gloeopeniophorella convolvens]
MAQPVFDQHPLQDYLRQSGDVFEPIPGALPDLLDSEEYADDPDDDLNLWSWLPPPALRLLELLNTILASAHKSHTTLREFSERFKYDIISSSLLSSSIAAVPPSSARRRSFPLPDDSSADDPSSNSRTGSPLPSSRHPVTHDPAWLLVLFFLCLISLFSGFATLCILIGTALYYIESYALDGGTSPDFMTPTLGTLNDLIAAAHLWDSTVQEAITLLEREESTTPLLSPASPLRVALHSSLQSTQVQADNVRHVLVGLTSPTALSQLSEMYAPPSPVKSQTPLHSRTSSTTGSRARTKSTPYEDKRATWNGSIPFSYAALASAGSPSQRSLRRWEKRRSDLSALLSRPAGATMSEPTSPNAGPSLEGVQEESGDYSVAAALAEHEDDDDDAVVPPEERGQFASAALELQRRRRSRGMEAFLPLTPSPPPRYSALNTQPSLLTHITRLSHKSSLHSLFTAPSPQSPSRFTTMQTSRHPLSLSALTLAVNGALSARRYAASHLLALRFVSDDGVEAGERESESEGYWDDVREVMALLTSALTSATAPLVEALDAAEADHMRAQNPTPGSPLSPSSSASPLSLSLRHGHVRGSSSSTQPVSFAPLPSHLSRFAAHVDALSGALKDAREHLEACVMSLRTGPPPGADVPPADTPAMQAYERLRRELGIALRECERGRAPLLELLSPPPPPPADDDEDEDDEEEDRVPALGADAESSDSEKDAPPPPSVVHAHGAPDVAVVVDVEERLPPPGIEQVFEADVDADALPGLARARSKLSRAERIAAAKARRAAGLDALGLGAPAPAGRERWGPGGDVVQELKDVIWKVGERRRRMEEQARVAAAADADADADGVAPADAEEDVFAAPASPVRVTASMPLPPPGDTEAS